MRTLIALLLIATLAGCGTISSITGKPGFGPAFGGTQYDLIGIQYDGFPLMLIDLLDLPLSFVADIIVFPLTLIDGEESSIDITEEEIITPGRDPNAGPRRY